MLAELEAHITNLVGHKSVDPVNPLEAIIEPVDQLLCGLLYLLRDPDTRSDVTPIPVGEVSPVRVIRVDEVWCHYQMGCRGHVGYHREKIPPSPAQVVHAVGISLHCRFALEVDQFPVRQQLLRAGQLQLHEANWNVPAELDQPPVVWAGLVGFLGFGQDIRDLDDVSVFELRKTKNPKTRVVVEVELRLRKPRRVSLARGDLGAIAAQDTSPQHPQTLGLGNK